MSGPVLSVCVATRNRAASLALLLRSLDIAQAAARIDAEVIVVDNGSTDTTGTVLNAWAIAAPNRTWLSVLPPGKSRALNRALGVARAPLLAFVDDDEEVAAQWLQAIVTFFTGHPEYLAGLGRVLPPPDFTDPELRKRLACYRTIAFFDDGDRVQDKGVLYGGNMVLRRTVFETVGGFDERLGPGAAGGWEDIDLAQRLKQAGLRIAYMPDVVVYHAIDPVRLTPEYFRAFQKREARSRFALDPQRVWRRAIPRLLDAALAFAWWSALRRPIRREHARGRVIKHAEMLRLSWTACRARHDHAAVPEDREA